MHCVGGIVFDCIDDCLYHSPTFADIVIKRRYIPCMCLSPSHLISSNEHLVVRLGMSEGLGKMSDWLDYNWHCPECSLPGVPQTVLNVTPTCN